MGPRMAPGASILLIEANSPFFSDLVQFSVDFARHQPGVVASSMSFGFDEFPNETSFDQYFATPSDTRILHFLQRPAITADRRLSGIFVERGGRGGHHVVGRCGGQLHWRIGLERQRRKCEHLYSPAGVPKWHGYTKHNTSSQSGRCLRRRSILRCGGLRFVQLRRRHTVDSGWRNQSLFPCLGLDHRRRRSGAGNGGLGSLNGAAQTLPLLYQLPATTLTTSPPAAMACPRVPVTIWSPVAAVPT